MYTARWSAVHWSEIIKTGIVVGSPKRDPATLRSIRKNKSNIQLVHDFGFVLVRFKKLNAPVDFSLKQSVWMSNVELLSLLSFDAKCTFEIEDYLSVNISGELLTDVYNELDDSSQISLSLGVATESFIKNFKGTWTNAWWMSLERAKWLSLIADLKERYELAVTGYGSGALSFYCWHRDMPQICHELKMKAAVLRQQDTELEAAVIELLIDSFSEDENNVDEADPEDAYGVSNKRSIKNIGGTGNCFTGFNS